MARKPARAIFGARLQIWLWAGLFVIGAATPLAAERAPGIGFIQVQSDASGVIISWQVDPGLPAGSTVDVHVSDSSLAEPSSYTSSNRVGEAIPAGDRRFIWQPDDSGEQFFGLVLKTNGRVASVPEYDQTYTNFRIAYEPGDGSAPPPATESFPINALTAALSGNQVTVTLVPKPGVDTAGLRYDLFQNSQPMTTLALAQQAGPAVASQTFAQLSATLPAPATGESRFYAVIAYLADSTPFSDWAPGVTYTNTAVSVSGPTMPEYTYPIAGLVPIYDPSSGAMRVTINLVPNVDASGMSFILYRGTSILSSQTVAAALGQTAAAGTLPTPLAIDPNPPAGQPLFYAIEVKRPDGSSFTNWQPDIAYTTRGVEAREAPTATEYPILLINASVNRDNEIEVEIEPKPGVDASGWIFSVYRNDELMASRSEAEIADRIERAARLPLRVVDEDAPVNTELYYAVVARQPDGTLASEWTADVAFTVDPVEIEEEEVVVQFPVATLASRVNNGTAQVEVIDRPGVDSTGWSFTVYADSAPMTTRSAAQLARRVERRVGLPFRVDDANAPDDADVYYAVVAQRPDGTLDTTWQAGVTFTQDPIRLEEETPDIVYPIAFLDVSADAEANPVEVSVRPVPGADTAGWRFSIYRDTEPLSSRSLAQGAPRIHRQDSLPITFVDRNAPLETDLFYAVVAQAPDGSFPDEWNADVAYTPSPVRLEETRPAYNYPVAFLDAQVNDDEGTIEIDVSGVPGVDTSGWRFSIYRETEAMTTRALAQGAQRIHRQLGLPLSITDDDVPLDTDVYYAVLAQAPDGSFLEDWAADVAYTVSPLRIETPEVVLEYPITALSATFNEAGDAVEIGLSSLPVADPASYRFVVYRLNQLPLTQAQALASPNQVASGTLLQRSFTDRSFSQTQPNYYAIIVLQPDGSPFSEWLPDRSYTTEPAIYTPPEVEYDFPVTALRASFDETSRQVTVTLELDRNVDSRDMEYRLFRTRDLPATLDQATRGALVAQGSFATLSIQDPGAAGLSAVYYALEVTDPEGEIFESWLPRQNYTVEALNSTFDLPYPVESIRAEFDEDAEQVEVQVGIRERDLEPGTTYRVVRSQQPMASLADARSRGVTLAEGELTGDLSLQDSDSVDQDAVSYAIIVTQPDGTAFENWQRNVAYTSDPLSTRLEIPYPITELTTDRDPATGGVTVTWLWDGEERAQPLQAVVYASTRPLQQPNLLSQARQIGRTTVGAGRVIDPNPPADSQVYYALEVLNREGQRYPNWRAGVAFTVTAVDTRIQVEPLPLRESVIPEVEIPQSAQTFGYAPPELESAAPIATTPATETPRAQTPSELVIPDTTLPELPVALSFDLLDEAAQALADRRAAASQPGTQSPDQPTAGSTTETPTRTPGRLIGSFGDRLTPGDAMGHLPGTTTPRQPTTPPQNPGTSEPVTPGDPQNPVETPDTTPDPSTQIPPNTDNPGGETDGGPGSEPATSPDTQGSGSGNGNGSQNGDNGSTGTPVDPALGEVEPDQGNGETPPDPADPRPLDEQLIDAIRVLYYQEQDYEAAATTLQALIPRFASEFNQALAQFYYYRSLYHEGRCQEARQGFEGLARNSAFFEYRRSVQIFSTLARECVRAPSAG